MNFLLNVLIAAVMVNCLVMATNGKGAADTLAVPYIDTLLPPFEDVQDNSGEDAPAKINATSQAQTTSTYKTTTKAIITSTTTVATTKKPNTTDGNNIVSELSIEALLPPLFEAKIEKEEATITAKAKKRPANATTKAFSSTAKPIFTTSTTTFKPNLKVPDLLLDPLQPPLFGNDSADVTDKKLTSTTTHKPITTKPTQKLHKEQKTKYFQVNIADNQIANKPALNIEHVAETKTQFKQTSLTSPMQNNKLPSNAKAVKSQYVAKEKISNSKYVDKQFNYSFDLYLGSTTKRPPKSGLPTITPFPHHLRR